MYETIYTILLNILPHIDLSGQYIVPHVFHNTIKSYKLMRSIYRSVKILRSIGKTKSIYDIFYAVLYMA